jgi:hypothetical protein
LQVFDMRNIPIYVVYVEYVGLCYRCNLTLRLALDFLGRGGY